MDVPLTPIVVDVVTFDRAPLGRRGYNEDQVDDFLDRVQATLAGEDNLTAHEVRSVEFDPAPFIRRGYHEDQVDEFLDLVVEELDRREATSPAAPASRGVPHAAGGAAAGSGAVPAPVAWVAFPAGQPRPVPPPAPAEQTNPMLFAQPPSLPSPHTQPLKRAAGAASSPPDPSVTTPTDESGPAQEPTPGESPTHTHPASVAAGQAASAFRAGSTSEVVETSRPTPAPADPVLADYAPPPAAPPAPNPAVTEPVTDPDPAPPATAATGPTPTAVPEAGPREGQRLPFPPAPAGEPGYAPADVARLMAVLAGSPDREQVANLTLTHTSSGGYHTGTVDALRKAWLDALPTTRT